MSLDSLLTNVINVWDTYTPSIEILKAKHVLNKIEIRFYPEINKYSIFLNTKSIRVVLNNVKADFIHASK